MTEPQAVQSSDFQKRSRTTRQGLVILHLFISVGALLGGGLLILSPDGSALGTPLGMLRYTPFPDYLIPGLLLFWVIGVGHMVAALALARHPAWAWWLSAAMGAVLMGWIGIQVLLIRAIHGIHVLFFGLGFLIAMAVIGLWLRRPAQR